MGKEKSVVAGFDIGGAHLKIARAENARIVAARTFATPIWEGLDCLDAALAEAAPLYAGAHRLAFTMTGELSDVFATRKEGVSGLIDRIERHFPAGDKLIYTVSADFVAPGDARTMPLKVASANWHATASLVAKLAGDALFVDMGSTTTDILALRDGRVANRGETDAGRLLTDELVYTGFTRSFPFGIASSAPVGGRMTPLMNEFFANMADVHRILGVLDENDDKHPTADGKPKTMEGSLARLARMVGRDAADLPVQEWRQIAAWFSEHQLREVHDAAVLVATGLKPSAPVVGAGIGHTQIARLADRMQRRYADFGDLIAADDSARAEARAAGPASAVALLAADAP
jgi:probable H4MPT-linked C1 transfer pathway protein